MAKFTLRIYSLLLLKSRGNVHLDSSASQPLRFSLGKECLGIICVFLFFFFFDASIDFLVLQKHVANMEFIAHSSSRKCVIVEDGLNIKDG